MDARFPERWLLDRRVLRLPAPSFRVFVLSLAWSVSNRTDGFVHAEDLPLIPGATPDVAAALADGEVWEPAGPGCWLITDFADTQTSRDQLAALDARRRSDRERKARQRRREAAGHEDTSRDQSRDRRAENIGQARTGEARTGSDGGAEQNGSASGAESGPQLARCAGCNGPMDPGLTAANVSTHPHPHCEALAASKAGRTAA
jgi:hypothetical protein